MPKRPPAPAVLLALIVVAIGAGAWIGYHFYSSGASWRGDHSESAEILHAKLKRDYQNGILSITVTFENTQDAPVRLEPPFARLLAANEAEVAPFSIDARSRPGQVAPSESKALELHYWLDPAHFSGPLDLFLGTERLAVKTNAPFEIESIPNQETVPLGSPDWLTKTE